MVPHPPLIVPEVGKGEEKKIQDTIDAYHRVAGKIGELKPETIVLISPIRLCTPIISIFLRERVQRVTLASFAQGG